MGLGCAAVDLIGQKNLRKDRAGKKRKSALALIVLGKNIRTGDIRRHQVGGELDAIEFQIKGGGQCFDEGGFSQTGDAFKENVAAGKEGHQKTVDDIGLANDYFGDLVSDGLTIAPE